MMKKPIFTIFVLLVLCLSSVYAGNESRIGTAGAQELLFPTSARGAAMGGSVVANSFGVDALYWNPAGAAYLDGTEAMFTHIPWIADIDIEYVAIATVIEEFGTVGFSLKVVSIGDMEETTEAFPDGTGRVFGPSMAVMGLSYAKSLNARVNFGFTGHIIREDIFEVSSTGFSFDFGFTYEPRFEGVRLGIVMKNFGPDMTFSGPGFDRVYEEAGSRPVASNGASFELPTSMNIGLSYNFYNQDKHSMTASANFRGNNHSTDYWQFGGEYALDDWIFLRGGYTFTNLEEEGADYIYGASLGGGVSRQIGSLNLSIEYTWWQTDVFDANQFFTLKAGF